MVSLRNSTKNLRKKKYYKSKSSIFNKWFWNRYPYVKMKLSPPYLTLYTRTNLKQNIEKTFCDLGLD